LWYNNGVRKTLLFLLSAFASVALCVASEEDAYAFPRWYAGAAGGLMLPGNGSTARRAAEVAVRGGYYFTETCALEGEAFAAPYAVSDRGGGATVAGGALRGLVHFTALDEFDKLFGSERFDPFATLGFAARFASHDVFAEGSHRTALGPQVGLGAFWHLTDAWSLRFDATAQLACDSPCGMIYGLGMGLQRSFGGDE